MFTFDGLSSSGLNIIENGVKHSILPPINPRLYTVPGLSGAYYSGSDIGIRTIEIDITIVRDSLNTMRASIRDVAFWLYKKEPKPLIFSDEPGVCYMAVLSGETDLAQIVNVGKGTLKFIVPEPFAQDVSPTNVNLGSTSTTISYTGTAKVYPVFWITISAQVPDFKVECNGKYVKINRQLNPNDLLVINTDRATISVNRVYSMQNLDIGSEFFYFEKGLSNTINLYPTGKVVTTGPNISYVTYNNRWL